MASAWLIPIPVWRVLVPLVWFAVWRCIEYKHSPHENYLRMEWERFRSLPGKLVGACREIHTWARAGPRLVLDQTVPGDWNPRDDREEIRTSDTIDEQSKLKPRDE